MTQVATHRFTVSDYDRMIEAGVFQEDDRIELLDGEIVDMSPTGYRHKGIVMRIAALFEPLSPCRAIISVQNSVVLDNNSEPEPDIALLRPRDDFYTTRDANKDDIHLVIEIAETSLQHDHVRKLPLYARNGIADYWIVDLHAGIVEIHRVPAGTLYRQITKLTKGNRIAPLTFPDFNVDVSQMLL